MVRPANDRFKEYFQEKLWQWVPEAYRDEDGLATNPDVLRSFIELFAEQAAVLRRSQDRLWDDQFIDICDDWAVPYLGDLLGTRLVSALNLRGRRIDVAKTIYYRRRKGTLRVLEELINDIAGWDGKVVEMFRRLARARHGLDPAPGPSTGRFTGTPPGGTADLRNPRGSTLAESPFDEYAHTPDVRRRGLYAIPKLAFYLFRVPAWEVEGVTPAAGPNPDTRLFDPSGRDIPLFQPRQRTADWDEWRSLREWEVPAPMKCRVLGDEEFLITLDLIESLQQNLSLSNAAAADLRRYAGVRFHEARFRQALQALPSSAEILGPIIFPALRRNALASDCGHAGLLPVAFEVELSPANPARTERIASGDLENWNATAPDRDVIVDPERGRIRYLNGPPAPDSRVRYHYGFPVPIGAGTWDRSPAEPSITLPTGGGPIAPNAIPGSGVVEVADSSSYTAFPDVTGISELTIQAADQQRPYLRAAGPDLLFDSTGTTGASLVLDALWIGGDTSIDLVLAGDYDVVTLQCVTLDPGGSDAMGNAIGTVRLVVRGNVSQLRIESSILSGVVAEVGSTLEEIVIQDSILQTELTAPASKATLNRVTIFGAVHVNRLDASEVLLTAIADVTDTQNGCFRFSSAPPGSRVPHPYESHFLSDSTHFFVSRRFGDPRYAQLSETAPDGLQTGAEDGSEIGAYSALRNPIKLASLKHKVEEFSPFGTIATYVFET
jgi:hypothetical protein